MRGELKVHHVTSGKEETGSFVIDCIIDSTIWDVSQIFSQPFRADSLWLLKKRQLPQNVEPAHSSVSA